MRFTGKKWLDGASYISDAKRQEIYDSVAKARRNGFEGVGVRPYAAGGISRAVAVVTVGHGMSIFEVHYNDD